MWRALAVVELIVAMVLVGFAVLEVLAGCWASGLLLLGLVFIPVGVGIGKVRGTGALSGAFFLLAFLGFSSGGC